MFRLLASTYATSVTNNTAWIGTATTWIGSEIVEATKSFFNILIDATRVFFGIFKWVAFWIICVLLGVLIGKLFVIPQAQPQPQQQIIQWPVNSTPDYLK